MDRRRSTTEPPSTDAPTPSADADTQTGARVGADAGSDADSHGRARLDTTLPDGIIVRGPTQRTRLRSQH